MLTVSLMYLNHYEQTLKVLFTLSPCLVAACGKEKRAAGNELQGPETTAAVCGAETQYRHISIDVAGSSE